MRGRVSVSNTSGRPARRATWQGEGAKSMETRSQPLPVSWLALDSNCNPEVAPFCHAKQQLGRATLSCCRTNVFLVRRLTQLTAPERDPNRCCSALTSCPARQALPPVPPLDAPHRSAVRPAPLPTSVRRTPQCLASTTPAPPSVTSTPLEDTSHTTPAASEAPTSTTSAMLPTSWPSRRRPLRTPATT